MATLEHRDEVGLAHPVAREHLAGLRLRPGPSLERAVGERDEAPLFVAVTRDELLADTQAGDERPGFVEGHRARRPWIAGATASTVARRDRVVDGFGGVARSTIAPRTDTGPVTSATAGHTLATMVLTVFRARLRPDADLVALEALGARMHALATAAPGFIAYKDFESEDGEAVTIVEFEDEASTRAWAEDPEHRDAQRRGREEFFAEYRIHVCSPIREHRFAQG